jgi:hypothetical protein
MRCANIFHVLAVVFVSEVQWRTQELFRRGGDYARNFFEGGGGVKQIQLRTEGREYGGSGRGSPLVSGSTPFSSE